MVVLLLFPRKKDKGGPDKKKLSSENWPDYVITLNEKNFDNFIKKYPLSAVDFWAPWCAPCRTMGPRLRRLSKIFKGKIVFGKLNTQENEDIAKKYKIMGIPHIIIFYHGKKLSSITGVKSVGSIKNTIEELLKKNKR